GTGHGATSGHSCRLLVNFQGGTGPAPSIANPRANASRQGGQPGRLPGPGATGSSTQGRGDRSSSGCAGMRDAGANSGSIAMTRRVPEEETQNDEDRSESGPR